MKCVLRPSIAFAVLMLSSQAFASDWYVDAAQGSNANGGTSPTDAWRTISHAIASTPQTGVQTIHIAAGTYDAALGEVFPIDVRADLQLVGNQGGAKPFLTASSGLIELGFSSTPYGPQSLIQGLALQTSLGHPIRISASTAPVAITLRDLDITTGNTAVSLHSASVPPSTLTLERVRVIGSATTAGAIGLSAWGAAPVNVEVRDSRFDGGHVNVDLIGGVSATFERCQLSGSAWSGARLDPLSNLTTRARFESCSISGGDNYGIRAELFAAGPGALDLVVRNCTLAANGLVDVAELNAQPGSATLLLERSILASPSLNLAISAASVVRDCLTYDARFAGSNGNFAADPLFVAPTSDWRLRWNSPCIDRIADANLAATLDLDGHARGVDGDLNRVELSDLGALEFQPLELVSTGALGSSLQLDSWGPQGNSSIVYWTRVAPVSPTLSIYGEFDLDLQLARMFRMTTVGSAAPTSILRQIPAHPALIGETYAFQALVDCAASPTGKAFTNVATVTFVP
jgi:hypothetical protein